MKRGNMFLFLLAFIVTAMATQQTAVAGECEQIIQAKCIECHYASRICQKLGKKSKRKWKRSLKSMKIRGAILSPAEEKTLLECLSKPSNEVKEFCQRP